MKKRAKRLIAALLLLCCPCFLVGCADLGAFADEDAYYASFGDIYFVCQSNTTTPEIRSYPLSEITNSDTQKNNTTVMPEDTYKYIVFQTLSDIQADDLAIWFLTEQEFDGNVKAEVFLSNTLLTVYHRDTTDAPYSGRYEYKASADSEVTEHLNFDTEGNVDDGKGHTASVTKINLAGKYTLSFTFSYKEDEVDKQISYVCHIDKPYLSLTVHKNDGGIESDMTYSFASEFETTEELGSANCIAEDTTHVKKGEWASVFIERWQAGDDTPSRLLIPKDTYIYIKILNNCAGAYRKNLSPISFRANNLLVRVLE